MKAMRAAFNNLERAAEYCTNGIPQVIQQRLAAQDVGAESASSVAEQDNNSEVRCEMNYCLFCNPSHSQDFWIMITRHTSYIMFKPVLLQNQPKF